MNGEARIDNSRCPVCGARFRGTSVCSRCGASLEAIMRIAVGAWTLRTQARQALLRGDLATAVRLAGQARRLLSD